MPFNAVFSHIIKKRIPRINRFSKDPISYQKENLEFFVNDLKEEGSTNIKHEFVRCNKDEPLTI